MVRIPVLLFVMFSFAACSSPTGVATEIATADSITINFFAGDGTPDSVHRVLMLTDK